MLGGGAANVVTLQRKKIINPSKSLHMARFIVTTKHMRNSIGARIEPGMSVEGVTQSLSNSVTTNGGAAVANAFMRIYGIDIRRAGALNMAELEVERIS